MKLPPHLSVRNNHLYVRNFDTNSLAAGFGTPLYVTDEERICEKYRQYERALSSRYENVRVLYAAKANGNLSVMRALAALGAGADVFSGGELELALRAGMKPGDLLFNGSSKTPSDLAFAVAKDVCVSVDSLDELHQLDAAAKASGKTARISFRVNPALHIPTHPKIATGIATSKFGIASGQIKAAYREALACDNVVPVGVHCHIGSQILDIEPFVKAAAVMGSIAKELTDTGVNLEFIDLGGGLGIPYHHDSDPAPTPEDYARAVMPVFLDAIGRAGISPALWVEPGRYLVADSTVLLTRVNSVKPAHKNFVNVDAGFNLLVRPVMYDSYHEVLVANKASAPGEHTYSIAGPICETGDILAHDRLLPEIRAGDLIAVLDAGAYGFAMSSQYNSRPRCAEVLIRGREMSLMRRAETADDVICPMVTPPWQR
ncbi:MAG TPA: diaminopimelate decarboxylase [Methanoregulaceae archaeon]|nr:diaminopimelate decarboxylase [Methanoregulaceae archaeon]